MSTYHPLNEQEAIEIARSLEGFFKQGAKLISREIGDGNLNLVFHISDPESNQSIILKQALPYAKVVGESWPLTLDRARIESEALILEEELAPGLVPKVYKYDAEMALTIMEDLSDHIIMRQGLMNNNQYPLFAEHISSFLAQTLFFTSDFGMNQQEKKMRVKAFINPELCKITEDLIFDDPYRDADTNNFEEAIRDEAEALWKDDSLHFEVALLREKFLTQAQSLLHGDLHTGSIFIKPDSTKVIDPEFAYYGPMGFDIGAVIANLLLNFARQGRGEKADPSTNEFRSYLLETIREIWTKFEAKFRALWAEHCEDRIAQTPGYLDNYVNRILQDTIGFAGCKMVRRIVGLAHVADIDKIQNPAEREQAQRLAISIGKSLIRTNRSVTSIEELIAIAQSHSLVESA